MKGIALWNFAVDWMIAEGVSGKRIIEMYLSFLWCDEWLMSLPDDDFQWFVDLPQSILDYGLSIGLVK